MSFSPKSALERMQDTYQTTTVPFEEIARGAQVPEAVRALAEKGIAQIRENYERSKDALDAVVESWERSFGASRQGAAALSRKVIDITQRNINSGFDLAKSLAGAKSLTEAMELQADYWRHQLETLRDQAEEVSTLSTQITTGAVARGGGE